MEGDRYDVPRQISLQVELGWWSYNQCRADSDRQALMRARAMGKPSPGVNRKPLVVDYLSLKRVEDEKSFWDNYPMFD